MHSTLILWQSASASNFAYSTLRLFRALSLYTLIHLIFFFRLFITRLCIFSSVLQFLLSIPMHFFLHSFSLWAQTRNYPFHHSMLFQAAVWEKMAMLHRYQRNLQHFLEATNTARRTPMTWAAQTSNCLNIVFSWLANLFQLLAR